MQLFKWFSAVCAVALCASFITVRADDNPAPAAAPEQTNQPTVTSAATPETNAPAETVAPASIPVTSPGAVVVQPGESATNVTKTVSIKTEKKTKAPQTTGAPNLVKGSVLQPIVAPPLPISADKQAQLQALLAKYMANAITPGQYQTERAKILADP
jgi:hypothetical protein